eukprot:COSAG05_NODE_1039_length_6069_cov_34.005999_4_plen_61_part_00
MAQWQVGVQLRRPGGAAGASQMYVPGGSIDATKRGQPADVAPGSDREPLPSVRAAALLRM